MECLSGGCLITSRNDGDDGGDGGDEGCGGGSDTGTKAGTGDGGSKNLDRPLGVNEYDSANWEGRKLMV